MLRAWKVQEGDRGVVGAYVRVTGYVQSECHWPGCCWQWQLLCSRQPRGFLSGNPRHRKLSNRTWSSRQRHWPGSDESSWPFCRSICRASYQIIQYIINTILGCWCYSSGQSVIHTYLYILDSWRTNDLVNLPPGTAPMIYLHWWHLYNILYLTEWSHQLILNGDFRPGSYFQND